MKTISKFFKSLFEVEKFQNKLYNEYNKVELVSFPHFSESGIYVFNVE